MDVHIPIAITEGLRRRNIDVLTSQEDATRELDDEPLLARATELGRLLFTQDQDFLKVSPRWQQTGRPFVGILYAHQQGVSLGGSSKISSLLHCVPNRRSYRTA